MANATRRKATGGEQRRGRRKERPAVKQRTRLKGRTLASKIEGCTRQGAAEQSGKTSCTIPFAFVLVWSRKTQNRNKPDNENLLADKFRSILRTAEMFWNREKMFFSGGYAPPSLKELKGSSLLSSMTNLMNDVGDHTVAATRVPANDLCNDNFFV
ncbi:hypothetical protein PRIPAC_92493 [Pristionchus pacificus]|uniref:Uncharacterized protein n=1 Tax=Pristionchus pacificus TaxID=54126 RepID=A0A2A6BPU9_PRIPA|nr:hypothetical protein PRIPAC_92493 [Pristionchus pacificus]|eukprot:PDM67935.1 hypothetical protein PRIPAC_45979 [Pristionchus pacificus]